MYILIIKEKFKTKFYGPYSSTLSASNDAFNIVDNYNEKIKWQIKELHLPIDLTEKDCDSEFKAS